VIELVGVSVRHHDGPPVLLDVDLHVEEGELVVVAGATGAGKSTLLRLLNGSVPHSTGGHVTGEVRVAGRPLRTTHPRDMADLVGLVGQNPAHGFVTAHVESELAFGMEQQGVAPAAMRRRVEETLDLVGIADLRDRRLDTLSAGQQQRVAVGAVLTAGPRVLVLDEPTSALDPVGAEEVLATLARLVHDVGLTVVLAEHRLERVVQLADRVVHVHEGRVTAGTPQEILPGTPLAPPVVRLATALGWSPVPLSVRDARRHAATAVVEPTRSVGAGRAPVGPVLLRSRATSVRHGRVDAVRSVDLDLAGGEVLALMGRNGSGKSSLLWALRGVGPRHAGTVDVRGQDPRDATATIARRLVGLVPQDVTDLLYLETVDEECVTSDRDAGVPAGTTAALLRTLVDDVDGTTHPRDLSEGQRLALVLALTLAAPPRVLLLDEPTRGLDHDAKTSLVARLRDLARDGTAVVVATHDVELASDLADRVVLMAQGEIVADGPARAMLTGSPGFAPQIARIMAPRPWMRLADLHLGPGQAP